MDALQQQLSNLRTQYELLEERCARLEKERKEMSDKMNEKDDTIEVLKSKIKDFKKRLEMSGVGANKDTSELELLRKNVSEMESIMKMKDFEIKKLKNQSNWGGGDNPSLSNPEDVEKIKSLQSELRKVKQKMEGFTKENGEMKQEMEKAKLEKEGMESLLNKKKFGINSFEYGNGSI